nr:MAG TPA: hypothetical protein [Caudoviricetes sp.]
MKNKIEYNMIYNARKRLLQYRIISSYLNCLA